MIIRTRDAIVHRAWALVLALCYFGWPVSVHAKSVEHPEAFISIKRVSSSGVPAVLQIRCERDQTECEGLRMEDGGVSVRKNLKWSTVASLFEEHAPIESFKAEDKKPTGPHYVSWRYKFGATEFKGGVTRVRDELIPHPISIFEARVAALVGR